MPSMVLGRLGMLLLLCTCVMAGEAVFKSEDGKYTLTYVAAPPSKVVPGIRPALLLCCHGLGGDAGQQVGNAQRILDTGKVRNDYVVIGIKAQGKGWENADDEPVMAFTVWALKKWNIDPRRVYGLGYSSGAFFLNRFVPSHSELMAGAITFVGSQHGVRADGDAETVSEIYWVSGQKDTTVRVAGIRPQAEAAVKAGRRIVYREMRDLGHDCCTEPPSTDAVQWLHALRNKRLPPTAEDQALLERIADADKGMTVLEDLRTWPRLMAIGGHAAAPALLKALASDKVGVRINAVTACAHMMFNRAVVEALVPLAGDQDGRLRTTVLEALTFQARWSYQPAEDALCAIAQDAKRKLSERMIAVTGLGQVVKLDLYGAFFRRRAIWTLVDLLDDQDAGLRQLAVAQLETAKTSGFGYQAIKDKDKRAAACALWVEWCTGTCGVRPETVAR